MMIVHAQAPNQKAVKREFTFQNEIWKRLALCAALLAGVGGCGSGDSFPGGGGGNQEPDPLISDVPMFYIERPLRMDETDPTAVEPDNIKDPITFHGGAKLYMKARAAQSAESIDLSARAVPGNVDVRDLDVSADGQFLLFALRAPQIEDADEEDQPTWNIWEYDIENDVVRRVISDNNLAEKGHDITPRYLPDGRILFASTRQQKARGILLNEGKPGDVSYLEESLQRPTLNLHVLDKRTQEVTQISFNQSHDLYPVVMANGKIIYTRWDRFGGDRGLHLYESDPDGTKTQLLYGRHSHTTGNNASELQFIRSNLMPDGSLFVLARPTNTTHYGGDFLRIDTNNYVDNIQPVNGSSGSGPAQTTVTNKQIFTDGSISPGGYFSAFFPMWDNTNRALVSWSQCRVAINGNTLPCTTQNLATPGAASAPPAYGLWIYDYVDNTQIPVVVAREGVVYTDVALGAEHTDPAIIFDGDSLTGVVDGKVSASTFSSLVDANNEEGILHIRSVYDLNGAFNDLSPAVLDYATLSNPQLSDASDRPARFLRIEKAVPEPPRDLKNPANGSFGNGGQRMKEIIGYAPVEPDGSVKVRVPANVALMLSVTDAAGKRLTQRHQNWISLRPGEVLECKGCHAAGETGNALPPHGRYDAQADSINDGQPVNAAYPGAVASIASPFANATMAEARVAAADDNDDDIMELSTDLLYSDVWTDPNNEAIDTPVSLRYQDLATASPTNSFCTPWTSRCRVVINYETHIQPIWELDRGALTMPILASDTLPATCTRCHSRTDAMGAAQVPAGQLELTDIVDGTNGVQNRAFVELFNADVPQLLDTGALVDCTQEQPRVDDNGDPVLDENDMQIIDIVACPASEGPYLSAAGARSGASVSFFALFETGSHAGYLTPAELRLIAEWLDIGAQYYNNHFDAPDN